MILKAAKDFHLIRDIKSTATPFPNTSLQHMQPVALCQSCIGNNMRKLLSYVLSIIPCVCAVLCEHYHHWPNKHKGSMNNSNSGKEINIKLTNYL